MTIERGPSDRQEVPESKDELRLDDLGEHDLGERIDDLLVSFAYLVNVHVFGIPKDVMKRYNERYKKGLTEEVPFSGKAKRLWWERRLQEKQKTSKKKAPSSTENP